MNDLDFARICATLRENRNLAREQLLQLAKSCGCVQCQALLEDERRRVAA